MKKIRIGINGFGRIGRLTLRAAGAWPEFEWVLINDPKGGAECAAHLLTFDSVQGRWSHEAVAEGKNTIRIGDQRVAFTEFAKPGEVDWAAHGVDVVLECSGKFRTPEQLAPFFERFDLLLTPTLSVAAFPVGRLNPEHWPQHRWDWIDWASFSYPFNFTGQPAATVPAGFTEAGLPVGLQIVGRRFDDVTVLQASAAFEQARPWAARRPALD